MQPATTAGTPPDLLPARMLNEFVYCPRLFHLEWAQAEWASSDDTVAGNLDHRRVDREEGAVPTPEELLGHPGFTARSVALSSPEERLTARIDLLEGAGGEVVPVDYKHGRAPDGDLEAWPSDRIQVGAQALLLRVNGYPCTRAMLWYGGSRRRVEIVIDDALLADVRAARDRALETAAMLAPPPPLVDSPKCPRCSLAGICLPDEVNNLAGRGSADPIDVRRLYAARSGALPVYVQAQGATVGKRGEELVIWERDKGQRRVRLLDTSQLSLFGNVSVSAPAIAALAERGVSISHFSYGGWFRGITQGLGPRNCALRIEQYRAAEDATRRLALASGFVRRKILNCRTLLRRNGRDTPAASLKALRFYADQASRATDIDGLLGTEGMAARIYFSEFHRMLRGGADGTGPTPFDFQGRNRRPPTDPVNSVLSLGYSVLARDWTVTLLAVGLDPYLGYLHQPRFGRPALALDMMEEFRPLIADSVVLQVLNNGEVTPADFVKRGRAVALTAEGRRKFFLAYERRMAHLIRHPLFGYRVSYRMVLELQARLLGRFLTGEIPEYTGLRTR